MSPRTIAPSHARSASFRPTRRAALAALLLPLAACTSAASGGDAASSGGGGQSPTAAAATGTLSVRDPWVKAAEFGMTAAFATVVNDTAADLVLIAVTTDASTETQLHETASDGSGGMSMQEKEGGFDIPAGGELVLEPGGNHLMLVDLTAPLLAGEAVELTLEFADGTTLPVTATVKDFAGAQEDYEPEDSAGSGASDGGRHDMDGHDMGDSIDGMEEDEEDHR